MKHHILLLCLICLVCVSIYGQESSAPAPPVYLNHLYLVLDEPTYNDITNSEFLRNELANFDVRTTVANGGESWTGAYVHGEHTYIELFAAGNNSRFTLGQCGIAFGVEQPGGNEFFYQRLKDRFPDKARTGLRTKSINEKDVPWFYSTGVRFEDEKSKFTPWLMEYHKDYLKASYPDLKPEENGITRQKYQARKFKADRLFRDVREVTIALNETEASLFLKELEAFDYRVKREQEKTSCEGPDIKFIVVPNTKVNGIIKLGIELLREKQGRKVYQFGAQSILEFKGKTAIWNFQ